MNQKAISRILLLTTILLAISLGRGVLGLNTTIAVTDTLDDVWRTTTGNVFWNTGEIICTEPDFDMETYLRFQDIGIPGYANIENATLRVYTSNTHGIDPNQTATIYVIDEVDCTPWGNGAVWSLDRPIYTYYTVTWNLTNVRGTGWHEVDITNLIKSRVYKYGWGSINDIGLYIISASGQEYIRNFEDYSALGSNQAQILIFYDIPPGLPPGIPGGSAFQETYRDIDIWNYTYSDGMANFTDMTQTGSALRLNVFNETVFNFTLINKSTPNVALGYFTNITGPSPLNSYEYDVNFTMTVDQHHATQKNPFMFMVGAELNQTGSIADIFAGNEIVGFDTYTQSASYYQFLPRFYGTGGPLVGNFSGLLLEDTWYMGKAILDGTKLRFEVRTMAGAMSTACQLTLPRVQDVYTFLPLACAEGVAGSQMDGWVVQDTPIMVTEFYAVENGTVLPTWNGDNQTDIDDLKDWIDDYLGADPDDPDPGTQNWPTTGPFTRFRMRLYVLVIGMGLIFAPLLAMVWRRPDAQTVLYLFVPMILGLGLLIGLGNI